MASSSENRPSIKPTLLPRTSSNTLRSIASDSEHLTSLPNLHTSKVRFTNTIPIPVRAPNLQLKVVTPLEEYSSSTQPQTLSSIAQVEQIDVTTSIHHSKDEFTVITVRPSGTSDEISTGSLEDPPENLGSAIFDQPKICISFDEDNPFTNGGKNTDGDASSSSSDISTLFGDSGTSNPEVRILDLDAESNTHSDDGVIDHKETRSYSVALELVYHPDVARRQYQERSGPLWIMAIKVLKNRFLSPLDMTEYVSFPHSSHYFITDFLPRAESSCDNDGRSELSLASFCWTVLCP